MIDVLIEAIDECIARVKKAGLRGLRAQDWLIVVGAALLLGSVIFVLIGIVLV